MTTNMSLLGTKLAKDQLFKFKYNGKTIYIKTGSLNGFTPKISSIKENGNNKAFFKIKDLDVYKKDRININNIEFFPIDLADIEGQIEIIDI